MIYKGRKEFFFNLQQFKWENSQYWKNKKINFSFKSFMKNYEKI